MLIHPVPGEDGEIKRLQLRRLDDALGQLESLNLKGVAFIPDPLQRRLRSIGVSHPSNASVTEVIDLVFRAQERFLTPTTRTGRRPAA
jgi:hypothetical protein